MSRTAKRASRHVGPWGMTPREAEVLDRLCRRECLVLVASDLRISIWTAKRHLLRVRGRMAHPETGEMPNGKGASIAWACWRQGQGVTLSSVHVPSQTPDSCNFRARESLSRCSVSAADADGDGVALRALTALNELDRAIRPSAAGR